MKCSHCGRWCSDKPAAPTHDYPPLCRSVCPGSGLSTIADNEMTAVTRKARDKYRPDEKEEDHA